MLQKNLHIFAFFILCFFPIQTMENKKIIDTNSIRAFHHIIQLPRELQKTILSEKITINYRVNNTNDLKLMISDQNVIHKYDKTIEVPKELIDTYKQYIVTNAIRYQYRADTRSDYYLGPLDTKYYNEKYNLFEQELSQKTPHLKALIAQTFDDDTYVITYASPESINDNPYRFFLHKMYGNFGNTFITPPYFSSTDNMREISRAMNIKEYEKIRFNQTTNNILLVDKNEYEKYTQYQMNLYASVHNSNNDYNYELMTYAAHSYQQALTKQENNINAILSACNALRLFHSDIFKKERKWFQGKNNLYFLHRITQMRVQLINNICKSDNPLLYLQDEATFPKKIKGSQNIDHLINIFMVKKNPDTLAVYGSLNSLMQKQNTIQSLKEDGANQAKINAIYAFCNGAQEIVYNLDPEFEYIHHHPIQNYNNILQKILDHTFSKQKDAAFDAALTLLKHTIRNSLTTIDVTYKSIAT